MQLTFKEVAELERVMDMLGTAAHALCDKETLKRVSDLRYLIAEMRVLAGNPRDLEAINRFVQMFTEEKT